MSKNDESKNGLSNREILLNLDTSISIAKGMLATLSLRHQSDWTRKLAKTEPEHLRILLLEVMEEIWSAETNLSTLRSKLEKSYMGICLH